MTEAGLEDGPFFVRRAAQKVLRLRKKNGMTHEAGMHKNDKWGINYFPDQMKALAIRCGFNDAENYTMRSNRRAGITKLASSTLGTANIQKAARHQSVEANRLYQQEDESDHVNRSKVFFKAIESKTTKKKKSQKRVPGQSIERSSTNVAMYPQQQFQQFPQQPMFPQPQNMLPQTQNMCMNNSSFQPNAMMMGMMGMMSGMMMGMMNPMMMGMNGFNGQQAFNGNQFGMMPHTQQQQQYPAQQSLATHHNNINIPQSSSLFTIQKHSEVVRNETITPYRCKLLDNYDQFDNGENNEEDSEDEDESTVSDTEDESDNDENVPQLPQFTQTQSYQYQASNFSTQPSNGASL